MSGDVTQVGKGVPWNLPAANAPPPRPGKVVSGVSGRVMSPTMAGGEEVQHAYSTLAPATQETIKNMDLVRGGHLSPEAAYNVLLMSKKKGQGFSDVLARHALGTKPSAPSPVPSSSDMVTLAPSARRAQAA